MTDAAARQTLARHGQEPLQERRLLLALCLLGLYAQRPGVPPQALLGVGLGSALYLGRLMHAVHTMTGNRASILADVHQASASLSQAASDVAQAAQDLSASTAEQTQGVTQLNTVIVRLHEIAGQNNTTSQELASTADTMHNQSAQLERLLGFFKAA